MTTQGPVGDTVSESETAELLQFGKELAREAGAVIRAAFEKGCATDYERKSATDPVTETDKQVEALLFGRIRARFPAHELIGEESAPDAAWTDAPTWIVDPIDGTANFVHRMPMCAVSIAFTKAKKHIVAIVYNPILEELFEATHVTCTKLNGNATRVSTVEKLNSAAIATEAGSDRTGPKTSHIVQHVTRVLEARVQCVRMLGSCALNLAYVACGRVDMAYERGPFSWDMAAGVLLVTQAGGVVHSGDLKQLHLTFDLEGRSIVAFTPSLRSEIEECLLSAA